MKKSGARAGVDDYVSGFKRTQGVGGVEEIAFRKAVFYNLRRRGILQPPGFGGKTWKFLTGSGLKVSRQKS